MGHDEDVALGLSIAGGILFMLITGVLCMFCCAKFTSRQEKVDSRGGWTRAPDKESG
jgi:hypothetical protein